MTSIRQSSLRGNHAGSVIAPSRRTHLCARCGVTIRDEYGKDRRKRQDYCLDCRQTDPKMTR